MQRVAPGSPGGEQADSGEEPQCGSAGRMNIPKLNLLNARVPMKDGDPGALPSMHDHTFNAAIRTRECDMF